MIIENKKLIGKSQELEIESKTKMEICDICNEKFVTDFINKECSDCYLKKQEKENEKNKKTLQENFKEEIANIEDKKLKKIKKFWKRRGVLKRDRKEKVDFYNLKNIKIKNIEDCFEYTLKVLRETNEKK